MSIQEKLIEFSKATGGDSRSYEEWAELRKKLLTEEFTEFVEAIDSRDSLRIAQEGADLTYVIAGTMVRPGIDLDAAVGEVHRANMSKIGPDGRFHVRDDGKILKGPNYQPPDMRCALRGHPSLGPVIYVAGPMTGLPEWNYPAFHLAATQLRSVGYRVISPAEHELDETNWTGCVRRGLGELLTTDAVGVLSGWQTSRGATLEVHVAEALGMEIRPVEEWLTIAGAAA
jgi:phosphoribosyl-ATP pyrophosphohydrolase